MNDTVESVIHRWHRTVNDADLAAAPSVVSDPVVVSGPEGTAPITPGQFRDWVRDSGITLRPRSWHPVAADLVVVEQGASWPQAPTPVTVATVFRVTGTRVSAALRSPDLTSALWLAGVCRDMAATA